MRHAGRISGWNEGRGFGFVKPSGGGEQAFVHVKAFERGGRRPVDGDLVSYQPSRDPKGRWTATRVRFADAVTARAKQSRVRDWSGARLSVALVFLAVLGGVWFFAGLADIVPLAFVLMSAVTFIAYGLDKSAARSDRRRTPESTLHLMGLLCGWPGALLAQVALRHKSRKASFQWLFWVTVALNVVALAWLLGSAYASALGEVLQ